VREAGGEAGARAPPRRRHASPPGGHARTRPTEGRGGAGLSTAKPVATARMLRKGGVDVINIADGPRATVRMSNSALAEAIQREVLQTI
jgi:hypothetical protein